jgi:hypothetical protein
MTLLAVEKAYSLISAVLGRAGLPFRSGNGIDQEHGNSHGADASRYRGDGRGLFLQRIEVQITYQALACLCRGVFYVV